MFLTSFYKNRKNEKLWKFPLFQGFSPQQICILKWLISQWIVFIVYYQISIIILVYHSWLTRKRPISNETPGLEYRRVHLNSIFSFCWLNFVQPIKSSTRFWSSQRWIINSSCITSYILSFSIIFECKICVSMNKEIGTLLPWHFQRRICPFWLLLLLQSSLILWIAH